MCIIRNHHGNCATTQRYFAPINFFAGAMISACLSETVHWLQIANSPSIKTARQLRQLD